MVTEPLKSESWAGAWPAEWRIMRSAPADGAYNMAVDSALLASARNRDFGVWRTYAWERPTISFGRNESVRSHFDAASLTAAGLVAVRRPTGGRALLHADEVTYSVTLPIAHQTPWTTVYAAVNSVLLSALRALGVPADLSSDCPTPLLRPDGPVCFDQPAPGEIVVRGAKLVGSAVWRERGAYLQHGSILLADSQHRLQHARRSAQPTPPAAATLNACLTPPPAWDTVATALEEALRGTVSARHTGALSGDAVPLDVNEITRHEVRFRDPTWLWRR